MRPFRMLPIVLAFLCVVTASAGAEEDRVSAVTADWIASIGANVWVSNGESRWEHENPPDALLGIGPSGSRLTFKDTDSRVFSVDADVVLWRRLVLTAAGAWGSIDDGKLIDEDFVSGVNFLRSRSTIDDGSVYFGNVNVGMRVVDWLDTEKRRGFLDVLVGYQWWREKYEAFGVLNQIPGLPIPELNAPQTTKAIEETWTWQSMRVGGRAYVPLVQDLGVRVNAFFLPWNSVEVEDNHPLRPDLQQNPSAILDGTGGFGWQAEVAFTYTIWRGLGVEAGYRIWHVKLEDGNIEGRPVAGPIPVANVKEIKTERDGFFAGLYYRF